MENVVYYKEKMRKANFTFPIFIFPASLFLTGALWRGSILHLLSTQDREEDWLWYEDRTR